jgi:hypothetical protein
MPVAKGAPSKDGRAGTVMRERRGERAEELLRAARALVLGAALGALLVLAARRRPGRWTTYGPGR